MGNKYTPGPWYTCLNASEPDQRRYVRSNSSNLPPCKLLEYVDQPVGEFEANAWLIAAAPEVYVAAVAVVDWLAEFVGHEAWQEIRGALPGTAAVDPISDLLAALAKARGEK